VIQPQPKCGFILVGTDGTIASWDYADHVTVQTRSNAEPHPIPSDPLPPGERNAIEYVLGCIARGEPLTGPLDPAVSLTGQRIVDTAAESARQKRSLPLVP
jgi:glucose-fructose oxidoreductase